MISETIVSFGFDCNHDYISRLHGDGLPQGPRVPLPSSRADGTLEIAVVTAEAVQKFILPTPYNHRDWRAAGVSVPYDDREQLRGILKELTQEKVAPAPDTKPNLRDALPLHEIGVRPVFWRAEDYESFEAAHADGAAYVGEWVEGWSALADVMRNVGIACDCVNRGSGDSIRARIVLGGHFYDVDRFAKQI